MKTPHYDYSIYCIQSIEWLKYITQAYIVNIKHACYSGEAAIKINGITLKVHGHINKHKEMKGTTFGEFDSVTLAQLRDGFHGDRCRPIKT